jgi:hypothetical protein
MSDNLYTEPTEKEYLEAQKRVRKIKKFYKELTSWASTSVILIALNLFLSGNISWAKYPVFFWGIFVLAGVFDIIRMQKLNKEWEARQMRKFTGKEIPQPVAQSVSDIGQDQPRDYSEELLRQEERELADLTEVRRLKRPWKDEDLV